MVSIGPPGGNGTTILIGRSEYCAERKDWPSHRQQDRGAGTGNSSENTVFFRHGDPPGGDGSTATYGNHIPAAGPASPPQASARAGKQGFPRSAGRQDDPWRAAAGRRDRPGAPVAPGAWPAPSTARCHHATDHNGEASPLRFRGERQSLREAAGLVELDVHGVIFAASASSEARACTLSSAQTGIGRSMRASAASRPSGNGCSISVTPTLAQAVRFRVRLSSVQPSLASTIVLPAGRRDAPPRSAPRHHPRCQLHLEQGPGGRPLRRFGHRCRRGE